MGECFLYGMRGSGTAAYGLNILSAGERPDTAEEDTVWIGTESAGGAYVVSPTAPEGKQGLVWIQTGSTGLAVTTQGPVKVVLYLRDAMLYQEDGWTPIAEAGIYRNGAWVLFCESYLMLYKTGNVYTDTTGGYSNTLPFLDVAYAYKPAYNSDHVYFDSHYRGAKYMVTNNKFVLDRYSKLVIDWCVTQVVPEHPDDTLVLYVLDSTKTKAVARLDFGPLHIRKTEVLDISGLEKNREYYIAVSTNVNTTVVNNVVSDVTLKAYLYSLELQV